MLPLLLWGCASDPMDRALQPDEHARNVVWTWRSADGITWDEPPTPIAWGMASLGLGTDDDGSMVLTGIAETGPPSWWEQHVAGPALRGLRWRGGAWEAASWDVDDDLALAFVDPQLFEGQAWYIAPTGSTDPAAQAAVPVRSAPPARTWLSRDQLADPAPIRIDGVLHLFLTHRGNILHLRGEPLVEVGKIMGANVPFPVWRGDTLQLLAQSMRDGRQQPVIATVDPSGAGGNHHPSWQPVVELGTLASCTSPVMGPHPDGGWLLACVEERGRGNPAAPPRPGTP